MNTVIKKAGVILLLLAVLSASWIAVVSNQKNDIERQDRLAGEADAYIEDKIYVYAVPLLEEAAGIESDRTYGLQMKLKDTYLKLGDYKKYYELLQNLIVTEKAEPDIYLETANYYFNTRKYKEALGILLKGFEKTGDEELYKYYEENRYRISKAGGRYQYISEIMNGAAIVKNNGKWGVVSLTGGQMIPCVYDKVSTYDNGAVIVSKDGEIYTVNSQNQRIALLKTETQDFKNLSESVSALLINGKWIRCTPGFLTGTTEFEDIGILSNGYMAVKSNGKWGVQTKNGEYLIPAEYEEIKMDELGRCRFQETVFVKKDGAYYLYNGDGMQNTAYDDAYPFGASYYAAVKKNGKWGFIDNTGREVLPFEWDGALSFGMHLAAVKTGDKWGYINQSGNIVIEPAYDEAKSFSGGCAPVFDGTNWMFIILEEYKN